MNSVIDIDLLKVPVYVCRIYSFKEVAPPHCCPCSHLKYKSNFFMEGRGPLHSGLFSSIFDLFTLDESKFLHQANSVSTMTTENVSKYCQWSLGGKLTLAENCCGKSCKIILPEPKTLVLSSTLQLLQHTLYSYAF